MLFAVAPARAQPYDGPPNGAAYWTVPAFKEYPLKGPEKARGALFWSHGVKGRETQYQFAPPDLVRRFARTGWDIIKIQRDPRNERGWITSGLRHSADLVDRANKAKADGYRMVIAAGQSYGGAISIEASIRSTAIDGVLALSPGQGSDATGTGSARMFDSLTDDLIRSLRRANAPRLVMMIAENDELHPFEVRGPKFRAALQARGQPFVLFDESMPIKGHGAGTTNQFNAWYGDCILAFLTGPSPVAGETQCPPPSPLPVFLYPANMRIEPPAPGVSPDIAALSGKWTGRYEDGREVQLVMERVADKEITFVYTFGSGPDRSLSMGSSRRTATRDQAGFSVRANPQARLSAIAFTLPRADGRIALTLTNAVSGAVNRAELIHER